METDSLVDLQVAIAEGDVSINVEAVDEPQEDGSVAVSGDGMQQEAEVRHNGPQPEDTAGADVHFEQVAENGQVAEPSGPLVGSIPGSVEASATVNIGNLVYVAAPPAQFLYVSGAHAPTVGTMPGVRSQLLDTSELYVLPDAVSAYGIFASSGANDARADNCNGSNHCHNYHHINNCSICSTGWTGLHVVHWSSYWSRWISGTQ